MVDQNLSEIVRVSLSQGKTKEEIFQELLGAGRKIDDILAAFRDAEQSSEKDDSHKKTIQLIVTFGAILIGAGFFSFIASNWQGMSKTLKISIIIAGILSAYSGGWFLREKKNFLRTGGALILLGSIIYGAGIFLIAQMFNVRSNWPDGFILWMLGVLVMGFATESYSLFVLTIILGFIAFFGYPVNIFEGMAGHSAFLLTSSFLLLVSSITVFVAGVYLRKKFLVETKDIY